MPQWTNAERWPRFLRWAAHSLFARHLWVLIALILFAQISSLTIFREAVEKPMTRELVSLVGRQLQSVRAGLQALPPLERKRFIMAYNEQAKRAEPRTGGMFTVPALQRMLVHRASRMLRQYGMELLVRREEPGYIWIKVELDGQQYWMLATASELPLGLSAMTLAIWLTAMVLAIVGALWTQQLLHKPLKRLVQASRQLGQGQPIEPLPEKGPTEVVEVSRSFNQMTRALMEQEKERTLMLAGVSHDLRTPLTKMRLAAEIMEDIADEELIVSMRQSCRQMDSIIDQFMDMARIGEGEELAPGDLVYLVEDAVSLMDMPIRCDLQPLPPVRLKPQAMQRVVINLLENARRYARPEFAVATWQEGERVYLAVTDQGPGIPEEKMGAMFTPFVRGNQARSGVPGAGLGLAIVQKIVHQHGGEVSLHNRPEGGLEVRISLPV
ncbi:two-component sensor histidine kinase [Pokkaliibacter plantistimulans]|uniref:histidine kinase n=1 Tax=Proteobacteria bacterium 228 TaxID=2083153 RepID=A0A2S5KKI3_9PROT|nr:ATP-binding protein [Pokkaliibacter plantistimulans]PPC75308.1 two-component sensor histidine kinase [Pokkaliibacter plantistimulans]